MQRKLNALAKERYHKSLDKLSKEEVYAVLLAFTRAEIAKKNRIKTKGRKLYYLSAEFLIGKLLSNNLINLGIYDKLDEVLSSAGISLAEITELEAEPSLGNGGLGRLAACFLDSISTLGLNGEGVGLNYHFGLFEQVFKDNKQGEEKNPWLDSPNFLEKTDVTFPVQFGKLRVKARLYQLEVTGYDNGYNNLNLFDIETVDESLVKKGIRFDKKDIAKNLTLFLYPDDSDAAGRKLRIYQQYFLVSSAAQLILSELKAAGHQLEDLAKYAVIQINDTHPALVIPELISLLTAEGISFDKAVEIVTEATAYTNHTILSEALEKWPYSYLKEVVPHLLPIIERLDKIVRAKYEDERVYIILPEGNAQPKDKKTRVKKLVHMAHLAIHFSSSTNGVAKLHTDILKSSELKPFYQLYPQRFNNKTNGITFRRWLMACNPELTNLIADLIGDGFKKDALELEKLLAFKDDAAVIDKVLAIKMAHKEALARYIEENESVRLDTNSVFDIQIKRLHEYKRQQLNLLYIVDKYLSIKKGKLPEQPLTVIFGAKAAPAYTIAKDIIHAILCMQELINKDESVSPYLKVVMVENYNVSYAERLIPACDISEQISLASKEASGTGNMKLMLNGAVTLGTMDGANVEIADLVGKDNIYIFGDSSETVIARYEKGDYKAKAYYKKNKKLKAALDFIISKEMLTVGDKKMLTRLYNELLNKDWFMTFPDFDDYLAIKDEMIADYQNRREWAKKMIVNIAKAGYFSADRTIEDYNRDVWRL